MKRSGFSLVELAVSVLIIACISTVLIIVLRSNLTTMKFGQKHMDFNQKVMLAIRRVFYDIKRINPILVKSNQYGYALKNEQSGEPKPRKIFIRKSQAPNLDKDELEFVIDSNLDISDIYNIMYYLKDNKLQRDVRNNAGQTTTETVLENVASFTVDNDPTDIKQVYVKLSVNDPVNKLKRDVDFAVRLETDFVYVDKRDL
ncbi:MAG: prepilin-type N-terminal cleavage/methylation domain-containing protein [Candidatus Riflebacteria bacterium]|nr:prepilin-type N-terminal cleavage/methylation domain-containing protein [Candidatus Riflebacteria bacterium]